MSEAEDHTMYTYVANESKHVCFPYDPPPASDLALHVSRAGISPESFNITECAFLKSVLDEMFEDPDLLRVFQQVDAQRRQHTKGRTSADDSLSPQ